MLKATRASINIIQPACDNKGGGSISDSQKLVCLAHANYSHILWLLGMETFYGISITHSLCSKHIACQKNGREREQGSTQRKPNLKIRKRQRQVNSLKIYTLFSMLSFHVIFPDLLSQHIHQKREGNTWGKTENSKTKQCKSL